MALLFEPVITGEQIEILAGKADEVWHEHFVTILSPEQIDYMVDRFQSVPAIQDQLKNQGYQYYFLKLEGQIIGYTGIKPENGTLFLSKLYILKPYRGRGYASEAFDFLEGMCEGMGLSAIWLTVNRNNSNTIQVYEHRGFTIIKTQAADIGSGYVMDDYIMEKKIP